MIVTCVNGAGYRDIEGADGVDGNAQVEMMCSEPGSPQGQGNALSYQYPNRSSLATFHMRDCHWCARSYYFLRA